MIKARVKICHDRVKLLILKLKETQDSANYSALLIVILSARHTLRTLYTFENYSGESCPIKTRARIKTVVVQACNVAVRTLPLYAPKSNLRSPLQISEQYEHTT